MRKWYFYGLDGPNFEWRETRAEAFRYFSKEAAEEVVITLKSGHHRITPSGGGARLLFHNFSVEEVDPDNFVISFDVKPESGLSKA